MECKFTGKKERFYIGKDFNCHRTWFGTPTWPPSREKGIYVYNAEKSRFVHEVSYSSQ